VTDIIPRVQKKRASVACENFAERFVLQFTGRGIRLAHKNWRRTMHLSKPNLLQP